MFKHAWGRYYQSTRSKGLRVEMKTLRVDKSIYITTWV